MGPGTVTYNIKEKDGEDVVDSGMADFYDPYLTSDHGLKMPIRTGL
jgi:hypothetical protein